MAAFAVPVVERYRLAPMSRDLIGTVDGTGATCTRAMMHLEVSGRLGAPARPEEEN